MSRYIPKECNDILIGYLRGNVYVGVTTGSHGRLTYALVSDKFKRKDDDKKKIQVFFEVSGIAIKRDDKLHYPNFTSKWMMIADNIYLHFTCRYA